MSDFLFHHAPGLWSAWSSYSCNRFLRKNKHVFFLNKLKMLKSSSNTRGPTSCCLLTEFSSHCHTEKCTPTLRTRTISAMWYCWVIVDPAASSWATSQEAHTHTHTVILSLHITRYQLALISWRLKAGPSIRSSLPQCSQQTWVPTLYLKQEQWLTGNHYVSISAHQMPETNSHQSHMTQDRPAAGYHGVHACTHTALR